MLADMFKRDTAYLLIYNAFKPFQTVQTQMFAVTLSSYLYDTTNLMIHYAYKLFSKQCNQDVSRYVRLKMTQLL